MTGPGSGPGLILDACCVLNLYASGRFEDILDALPLSIKIARLVAEGEALWVGADGPDVPNGDFEVVSVYRAAARGLLEIVDLEGQDELTRFVDLAEQLDDGEAASGAIAACRFLSVGTDDRVARRALRALEPSITIVSTAEILNQWAALAAPTPSELRSALQSIELRASFRPPRGDALRRWWLDCSA